MCFGHHAGILPSKKKRQSSLLLLLFCYSGHYFARIKASNFHLLLCYFYWILGPNILPSSLRPDSLRPCHSRQRHLPCETLPQPALKKEKKEKEKKKKKTITEVTDQTNWIRFGILDKQHVGSLLGNFLFSDNYWTVISPRADLVLLFCENVTSDKPARKFPIF